MRYKINVYCTMIKDKVVFSYDLGIGTSREFAEGFMAGLGNKVGVGRLELVEVPVTYSVEFKVKMASLDLTLKAMRFIYEVDQWDEEYLWDLVDAIRREVEGLGFSVVDTKTELN